MSQKIKGDNFASLLSKRPHFYSDPGSRDADIYEVVIDEKGHKTLKFAGTKDIYEDIQSYKDECDIKLIVARASAGDPEALNQREGFYADITNTPANLAEAQNIILKLSNEFDSLPTEIREKFDNSKEVFVHTYGTNDWAEKMGFIKDEENKTEKINFIPGTNPTSSEILTPEA